MWLLLVASVATNSAPTLADSFANKLRDMTLSAPKRYGPSHPVDISDDCQHIVTGSSNYVGFVHKFAVETGKDIWTYTGHTSTVWSLAISKDLQYVVTGSHDKTAALLNMTTGKEIWTFVHSNEVKAVAISTDSKYVATGYVYVAVVQFFFFFFLPIFFLGSGEGVTVTATVSRQIFSTVGKKALLQYMHIEPIQSFPFILTHVYLRVGLGNVINVHKGRGIKKPG